MTVKKSIVIVGGGIEAPIAAAKARQANEHAHITLVSDSPVLAWSHFTMRHHLAHHDDSQVELTKLDEALAERFNITVVRDAQPVSLDADARCLLIEAKDVRERLYYDALIYAAGGGRLSLPGENPVSVFNFQHHQDIMGIMAAIKSGARTAVVVGCGSQGIDAALGLMAHGILVTILESNLRIGPKFSLHVAHAMFKELQKLGALIKLGTKVSSHELLADGSLALTLSTKEQITADIVIVATGITPKNELLEMAGASIGIDGLVRVDDYLCTTLPDVYACGVNVSVPMAVTLKRKWVQEPSVVVRTAEIAGFNAAYDQKEKRELIKPVSGTVMITIKDRAFARTGLDENEARSSFGDDQLFVTTVFATSSNTCVKLIVSRPTGHIVGGEVYGESNVAPIIDVLSIAVLLGFSPNRLIDLDLVYPCETYSVFDPLKDAALRARMALEENTRSMSAETLALWLKNDRDFCLVDVSQSPSFSKNCLKRSLHVPFKTLREKIEELKKESSPLVLYSRSGNQSYLAQQVLKKRGFTNVYHLDGGLASFDLIATAKE